MLLFCLCILDILPIKDLVVWKTGEDIPMLIMQHSESSEVSGIGGSCISL